MVLETVARVGSLRLNRSARQEELLRYVMQAAQGGGLPTAGYDVAHAGGVVWAVVLPCRMEALPDPRGPMKGHGVPSGGNFGVGVHVAHPSGRHGPAATASPSGGILPVLGTAHNRRKLGTMWG